jgi:hypothetical protein
MSALSPIADVGRPIQVKSRLALTHCLPGLNAVFKSFAKWLILLERAVGFEPTTPTLARLKTLFPVLHPLSQTFLTPCLKFVSFTPWFLPFPLISDSVMTAW